MAVRTVQVKETSPPVSDESEFQPYIRAKDETVREFTFAAVFIGSILGIIFSASSLYLVLKVGMTVSAFRWALIDRLHAMTGLAQPFLDFSRLQANLQAITLLIEIHYRHYQFYANMFVATAAWYVLYRASHGWGPDFIDAGVAAAEFIFFLTSRDTLRKYYTRSAEVLRSRAITSLA